MADVYKGIPINTTKNTHKVVFELINASKDAVIADMPSGAGAFVKRLVDQGYTHVLAMDIACALVFDHPGFLKGDMTRPLPFEDQSVDVFVCIDGIEHISDQFFFVSEVNRVLKQGGTFILSTPNISALRSRFRWLMTGHHHKCKAPLDENKPSPLHHIGMVSFPELRYMLHTNGFAISRITTNRIKWVSWLHAIWMPLVLVFTTFTYRKEGRIEGTTQLNKAVKTSMFSKPVLFGETLIIRAEKA
ncbi:MAG: methyltransferase domain-containing protein [Bacteroidetes bacterium]|nr:methyltransferase domain-containing protein [Bacteroidota bacterium]